LPGLKAIQPRARWCSYFFIGGKETNTLIRDGAREGIDRAEELSEEIRDGLREELLKPAGQ